MYGYIWEYAESNLYTYSYVCMCVYIYIYELQATFPTKLYGNGFLVKDYIQGLY